MPSADATLTHDLEAAEGRALRSAYEDLPPDARAALGTSTTRIGDGVAIALTALPVGMFNRVIGLGTIRAAVNGDVAAIQAFYEAVGVAQAVVQLPPGTEVAPLTDWLAAAGFAPSRRWVKLWHDLEDIPDPATSLRIERIGPDRAAEFTAVCIAAFEIPDVLAPLLGPIVGAPGWSHYIGYDDDQPVAAGALYVEDGLGWLGWGSTLESHRGRGGQSAIFAARMRDARELGCRMVVTETGEEDEQDPVNHSYRNMVRLGFRLAYARRNWVHKTP
jgi:GNAT superfamily N-acetyltransferase